MSRSNRREFLADVGRGMFVASLGAGLASDIGLTGRAWAEEEVNRPLDFGDHEPLVRMMQETPADKIISTLSKKLTEGATLKQLLTAAALANGRTFGGEDYIGFHTLMAIGPSWYMAQELPEDRRAVPIFKVLYRNANRIQETGGRDHEVLHSVESAPLSGTLSPTALRDASRAIDIKQAERMLATFASQGAEEAFNAVLMEVEDETEVHRVSLPARAWDLMGIIGREHALTFLRQSLRYCIKAEPKSGRSTREALAAVFDQYKLEGLTPGSRIPDDQWVEQFSTMLLKSTPKAAAEAAGAALAEGIAPEAITEAAAVAANQILLRDPGRPEKYSSSNKPAGSVHGDSMGLHCCDAVYAWRTMARVANPRNQCAATVLSAYQVASNRTIPLGENGEGYIDRPARPFAEDLERIQAKDPAGLLAEAEQAIRANNQPQAAAAVHLYGQVGSDPRPVFDLMLKYAMSEDGALHAEKYYRTVTDEFATLRPAFRWSQVVALARVTASAHGYPAPGYDETCRTLGIALS
jgi:hypothetical protein